MLIVRLPCELKKDAKYQTKTKMSSFNSKDGHQFKPGEEPEQISIQFARCWTPDDTTNISRDKNNQKACIIFIEHQKGK